MAREDDRGALWLAPDMESWTGRICGQQVTVKRNGYKQDGDNSPDLRVYAAPDGPKIGGFWRRESRAGKEFYTGSVTTEAGEERLVMFPNDQGDNPARPVFRVLLSKPREDAPPPAAEEDEECPF